jgi:hypothetical protein
MAMDRSYTILWCAILLFATRKPSNIHQGSYINNGPHHFQNGVFSTNRANHPRWVTYQIYTYRSSTYQKHCVQGEQHYAHRRYFRIIFGRCYPWTRYYVERLGLVWFPHITRARCTKRLAGTSLVIIAGSLLLFNSHILYGVGDVSKDVNGTRTGTQIAGPSFRMSTSNTI